MECLYCGYYSIVFDNTNTSRDINKSIIVQSCNFLHDLKVLKKGGSCRISNIKALVRDSCISFYTGDKFERKLLFQVRLRTRWRSILSIEDKDISLGFTVDDIKHLLEKAGYILNKPDPLHIDPLSLYPIFVCPFSSIS